MTAIEKFINRYDAAIRSKSPEMRLQMTEASELVHEIAVLGIRASELAQKLIALQERVITKEQPIYTLEVHMDGGTF